MTLNIFNLEFISLEFIRCMDSFSIRFGKCEANIPSIFFFFFFFFLLSILLRFCIPIIGMLGINVGMLIVLLCVPQDS